MSKISEKFILCVCEDKVHRPDELIIQCIVCKRWLHAECLGMDADDLTVREKFICVYCGTAILVVNTETDEFIQNVPVLGADNDHVICCCDEQNESGFMLQCERCETWQHGKCMKLKDGQTPDTYFCHICRYAKKIKIPVSEARTDENGNDERENDYICKICGQEFDCGQALVYHKTYEKCLQSEEIQISNSEKLPLEKLSDNLNGSNNRDLDTSVGSITIDKIAKQTGDKISRRKPKSLSKNVENSNSKTKNNNNKLVTVKASENTPIPSKLGNGNVSKTANLSTPSTLPSSTTTSSTNATKTNTQSDNPVTQSNIYDTQSTIHDVHVTKLKSSTAISQTTNKEVPTFACGGCSLAFADTSSLKSHHLKTPNCSSKVIQKATPRLRLSPEELNSQDIDESINCLCNLKIDKGVMIQCDICQNWQHTACIGLRKKQNLPTNYCCFDCVNQGCFSLIIDMCKKQDVSIQTISQNFKDRISNISRKRKVSKSPTDRVSETKKLRKETDCEDETMSLESEEVYSSGPSSPDEYEENKQEPQKVEIENPKKKKYKVKPKRTSLIRCSRNEINAIQEYFTNLLSEDPLFTHIQPDTRKFKQLTCNEVLTLLPDNLDFPKLEITSNFDTETYTNSLKYLSSLVYPHGNQLIINAGAPVNTLAWVPGILNESKFTDTIYLAVTTQPSFQSKDYLFVAKDDVIEEESQTIDVVQIWDVTIHKHLEKGAKLSLGIIFKQGKIMDMQWCPSGCFDDIIATTTLPRLGLLLVALNTGKLGITAIPHPNSIHKKGITSEYPWFDNQFFEVSQFDLILELTREVPEPKIKCMCCDWSLHPGHNRIVAGFQNGSVAVWNLNAKIFCNKTGPVPICMPIYLIGAHDTAVTSIAWSPQNVYLFATACHDVTAALVWDTRDTKRHVTDLYNFQVCITWALCWPLSYLRPICGLELLPKNKDGWYGNLFSNTYKSMLTKNSTTLSLYYPQCPTICSISWSMLDCALLLGSFSGELIFLNSFFHAKKTQDRMQPKKILDISVKTDQDANELLLQPFDVERIKSIALDFDYSCFANCIHAQYKSSEETQESLVNRLLKQDLEVKSPKEVKRMESGCELCGKKFSCQKSLQYHIEHDVCKGGTVDNRGSFTKPTPPTTESSIKAINLEGDKLMLQQIREQMSDNNFTEKEREPKAKPKPNKHLIRNPKIIHECGPARDQSITREKTRDNYSEYSQAKIKQVRWFPNAPYQNVFAAGTGLGIITISAIPEP